MPKSCSFRFYVHKTWGYRVNSISEYKSNDIIVRLRLEGASLIRLIFDYTYDGLELKIIFTKKYFKYTYLWLSVITPPEIIVSIGFVRRSDNL